MMERRGGEGGGGMNIEMMNREANGVLDCCFLLRGLDYRVREVGLHDMIFLNTAGGLALL